MLEQKWRRRVRDGEGYQSWEETVSVGRKLGARLLEGSNSNDDRLGRSREETACSWLEVGRRGMTLAMIHDL